jgi:hypothetical protein
MGKLAVVGLKYIHGKPLADAEVAWLIQEVTALRWRVGDLEGSGGVGNHKPKGHVVELTEFGYKVEHTPFCGGVATCPLHYRLTTEYQDSDGFERLDDGLYWVEPAWDGTLVWQRYRRGEPTTPVD